MSETEDHIPINLSEEDAQFDQDSAAPPGSTLPLIPSKDSGSTVTIAPQNGERLVRGVVSRVTFRNPQNGYCVLQVNQSGSGGIITVVGIAPNLVSGAYIVASGKMERHSKYGMQLSADSIAETLPSSPAGIEKYLSSGLIKGVGKKTAERIVSELGDKAIEVICQDVKRVAEIPGVGIRRANLLQNALLGQQESQEIMRFLVEHHVSPALSERIRESYGKQAIDVLTRDPYRLARDMRGIGFQKADTIALNLGLPPTSPQRLKGGLYYALERASDEGHCFLPEQKLYQKAQFLLGLEQNDAAALDSQLQRLIDEGYVTRREDACYLRHLEKAEDLVARFVASRIDVRESPLISADIVNASIAEAERALGVQLSADQRAALEAARNYRLLVITGGPGCGKTTVIRAITSLVRKAGKRLALAAPTGRAAQRMAQVCEIPASTIHRLLKYDPIQKRFQFGAHDPLPTDVVIIDEASMLDIQLARDLFSAVPANATLVLVGDKDQLPSVGPGRVFGDLVALKDLKIIALSTLFRRAEESAITWAAHQINAGIIPSIPEPDGHTRSDAYYIARSNPAEAAELIEKLVADQITKKFGFDRSEISVLTPSNRGELGAERLNQRLQAKLNPEPPAGQAEQIRCGNAFLRVGDRVCQRVNNYQIDEIGVFNGDLGTVYSANLSEDFLMVEMWDGRLIKYKGAEISQLSLAYAVTVHRSQGSEIPCVVLALHDSHYTLLDRQLLYTAVTRAKRLLIIVGSKRALMMACRRTSSKNRQTALHQRIMQLLR